jgi:hypothetical protein
VVEHRLLFIILMESQIIETHVCATVDFINVSLVQSTVLDGHSFEFRVRLVWGNLVLLGI